MTTEEAIAWFERGKRGMQMPGAKAMYDMAIAALRAQQEAKKNPGEVSDGYHTFNELYHHRAVLFSVICNQHPELAWKARKHHDGTMYDGMFIVGIETPEGPATYHFDDPYWNMFRVPELECAPQWDGHTPAEAIRRIGTLAEAELCKREKALTGSEAVGIGGCLLLEDTELSSRSYHALTRAGCKTLADVETLAQAGTLPNVRNLGSRCLEEVLGRLEALTGKRYGAEG